MGCNEERAVAELAGIVAFEYGMTAAEAKKIRTAASLHDIGKLKISPKILHKKGRLTAAEFEVIKTHTTLGAAMLEGIQGEIGAMARLTALYHHEWYSGGGYWDKRAGELSLCVQITAISDVFTALVCERSYKKALPPGEALSYIQSQSGSQFNPALVDIFLPLMRNDSRIPALFGR
jgi:HD-GYP domain-containing protein (c-di-GMP phosphodiesterase class II)